MNYVQHQEGAVIGRAVVMAQPFYQPLAKQLPVANAIPINVAPINVAPMATLAPQPYDSLPSNKFLSGYKDALRLTNNFVKYADEKAKSVLSIQELCPHNESQIKKTAEIKKVLEDVSSDNKWVPHIKEAIAFREEEWFISSTNDGCSLGVKCVVESNDGVYVERTTCGQATMIVASAVPVYERFRIAMKALEDAEDSIAHKYTEYFNKNTRLKSINKEMNMVVNHDGSKAEKSMLANIDDMIEENENQMSESNDALQIIDEFQGKLLDACTKYEDAVKKEIMKYTVRDRSIQLKYFACGLPKGKFKVPQDITDLVELENMVKALPLLHFQFKKQCEMQWLYSARDFINDIIHMDEVREPLRKKVKLLNEKEFQEILS